MEQFNVVRDSIKERYHMGLRGILSGNGTGLGIVPTEQQLERWSYRSSIGKSLKKIHLTDYNVKSAIADASTYQMALYSDSDIMSVNYRVKTMESIIDKVYRRGDMGFLSVFNDILGIRIFVNEYPSKYPDCYRVVDMSSGKKIDDGYRAVHLYYTRDNYSYPIEVQLWSRKDKEFNMMAHANGYKSVEAEMLSRIRQDYDNGFILSNADFKEALGKYDRNGN